MKAMKVTGIQANNEDESMTWTPPYSKRRQLVHITKLPSVSHVADVDPHADGHNAKAEALVDSLFPSSASTTVYSSVGVIYSAYLEQIDPSINAFKFYVLQLLQTTKGHGRARPPAKGKKARPKPVIRKRKAGAVDSDDEDDEKDPDSQHDYVLWTRWRRMGSCGSTQVQQFDEDEEENAKNAFDKKFRDKCGVSWEHRQRARVKVSGKYRLVTEDIPIFSLPDSGLFCD